MGKKVKAKGRVGKVSRRTRAYHYEFRLHMVRLYLEERYSITVYREHSLGLAATRHIAG